MKKIIKIETPLEGCFIIKPIQFGDERGFFLESYNRRDFAEIGLNIEFVQDNHSRSGRGVLRGLHYQYQNPQGKLVRVVGGAVYDVAVDLRPGSASFGKWHAVLLSEENKDLFYIPPGMAHGFLTLTDSVDFLYKCTDYYYPEYDAGIIYNDPDLKINWPFAEYGLSKPKLSEKDSTLPSFKEYCDNIPS